MLLAFDAVMGKWPAIRDAILFFGGLAGVAHQELVASSEKPTLILIFAAMMGLPAFLRADERKRNGKDE